MKKIITLNLFLLFVFALAFMSCESTKIGAIDEQNFVEIDLGKLPENTRYISIYRRVKGEEGWNFWTINLRDLNKTSVKDYFTVPNTTYEYKIQYEVKDPKTYLWSYPSVVVEKTAIDGYGDLTFSQLPKASYNSDTTILDFSVLPQLDKRQEKFINSKNGRISSYIYYVDTNKDNNDGEVIYTPITKEVNCSSAVKFNKYDTPLYLNSISIVLDIDGLRYQHSIDEEEILDVPNVITVKDTRPKLKLENCNEGTKIYLPEEAKNADFCTIEGIIYCEGKHFNIRVDMKNKTDLSIINYFTVPGKKYSYRCTFGFRLEGGGEEMYYTDYNFIIADSGKGYIDFDSRFESIYDDKNGIMSFKTNPKLKQDAFIKEKGGSYKVLLIYQIDGLNNGEQIYGRINDEGIVDFKQIVSKCNWFDKSLIPTFIHPVINIDGYEYEAFLSPSDYEGILSGLTNPLVVSKH